MNFVRAVTNPFLPYKPGTRIHFEVRGTTPQTDDELVLHKHKRVLGEQVHDRARRSPSMALPVERTFDWYAQDKQGNVWYMGENSLELKNGRFVRASDSWESGVNGGKPGIIMPGHPRRGDRYRQEACWARRSTSGAHAGCRGAVTVPYGSFDKPSVTLEYSPLEPQTEKKYYVRGVGEVKETVVKGHHETFSLVSVTTQSTSCSASTGAGASPDMPSRPREPNMGPRAAWRGANVPSPSGGMSS